MEFLIVDLSQPIDVYSDWMDDFAAANKPLKPTPAPPTEEEPTAQVDPENWDEDSQDILSAY